MALVEGPGLPGGSRRWPRALGRAPRLASVLLAREEDDRGGSGGGLGRAGPVVAPGKWLEELGQVGFSLFLFSVCFIFYLIFCHCFEFKIIQTMPKAPLNIFILLYGLFQKLINISGVFEIIF